MSDKLYSVCCATNVDDLNWIPWITFAHEEQAKIDRDLIQKHYQDFRALNLSKLDEDHPDFDDDNSWLYADDEDLQWEKFNDYMEDLGYKVFHAGKLAWLCD